MRTYAEFKILGDDISPDEMGQRLDLAAHETWMKGDVIARTILTRPECGWSHHTVEDDNVEVADHVQVLIDIFLPKRDVLKQIAETNEVEYWLSCVVYTDDAMPALDFTPTQLGALADLDIYLDIDIIG